MPFFFAFKTLISARVRGPHHPSGRDRDLDHLHDRDQLLLSGRGRTQTFLLYYLKLLNQPLLANNKSDLASIRRHLCNLILLPHLLNNTS
jgi:hypothetical protein